MAKTEQVGSPEHQDFVFQELVEKFSTVPEGTTFRENSTGQSALIDPQTGEFLGWIDSKDDGRDDKEKRSRASIIYATWKFDSSLFKTNAPIMSSCKSFVLDTKRITGVPLSNLALERLEAVQARVNETIKQSH